MLMGRLSLAADTMAVHIVAAPPMSALMRSMFAEGLMEMPTLWGDIGQCTILVAKKRAKATFLKKIHKLRVNHHIKAPSTWQRKFKCLN